MSVRRPHNRYFVDMGGPSPFKVSAAEWQKARSGGWIEPIAPDSRVARLCAGVVARIKGGVLWLRDKGRDLWLKTSWLAIDNIAPARGEHWQRLIEREYGPGRSERYGEIKRWIQGMSEADFWARVKEMEGRRGKAAPV